MRLCARGPSGTFTASTPASFSFRTSAIMRDASTPRGGTISTDDTNSAFASFAAHFDRSANGTGSTDTGGRRSTVAPLPPVDGAGS